MKKSILITTSIVGTILILLISMVVTGLFFSSAGESMAGLPSAYDSIGSPTKSRSVNTGGMEATVKESSSEQVTTNDNFQNMYFVDYGTHVFLDPSIRPFSTFALDVDSASYTIAKNYIMNGRLPPKDAIRPEEFINYFDYNYESSNKKINIFSSLASSPFDEDVTYMKIGMKAKESEIIKPKKITLVIDISGSMSQNNRLGLLKKSLSYLINNLDENDYVSIITYNQNANLFMDIQKASNKDYILSRIDSLNPGGSTNAEAGLKLGYSKANDHFNSEYVNRVILLSDGVANVGTTDPDGILAQLIDYKKKGITLTSIGVGMGNYNDVLLEQIADKADGNYYYINDLNEGIRVFDKQIQATMEIAGRDSKLQVEFNDEIVESYRLIGYENRGLSIADFNNESADAGEIGKGHEATALYELKLKSNNGKICDVHLKYKDNGESLEEKIPVFAKEVDFNSISDNFKLAISVARFAQILKMTAPPPQIDNVQEIASELNIDNISFNDFKDMIANTQYLINEKR